MPILNEDLRIPCVNQKVVDRFFRDRVWKKVLVPNGIALFKFTEHVCYANGVHLTPWWAPVKSTGDWAEPEDGGLDEWLQKAKNSGKPIEKFVREVYSVRREWNGLGNHAMGLLTVQFAHTVAPVYGFYGIVAPVKRDDLLIGQTGPEEYPGGATQLCIPNLTYRELNIDGRLMINNYANAGNSLRHDEKGSN